MSYWERLKASTRHLKGMRYSDTVKVEVWYDCTKNYGDYLPIILRIDTLNRKRLENQWEKV